MKKILYTLLVPLMGIPAVAQETAPGSLDFTGANNYVNYTILDAIAKTCQTKAGSSVISMVDGKPKLVVSYGTPNDGSGVIEIPSVVSNGYDDYTVVAIGSYSFKNAIEVKIPSSVVQIDTAAFNNTNGLARITIPSSVTQIGENAFRSCTSLVTVNCDASITYLEPYTFAFCTSLSEITLPSTLTTLGDYAFQNDGGLVTLTIPAGVTAIGKGTFSGCTNLQNLTLPEGLATIGATAFYNNRSLTSLTLPAGVNSIGDQAFYSCSNLTEVISLNPVPPVISSNTFSSQALAGTLKVPYSSLALYKKSPTWGQFANIEAIPLPATGITLDKSTFTLSVGFSGQLKATLTPADASDPVVWSIVAVPEGAAEIDQTGKFIAHMVGTATVTATAGNVNATCDITITQNTNETVKITTPAPSLYVGQEVTMTATVTPSTITTPITWISSNDEIATIDATSGVLRGVAPGTAVITASCEGKTAKTNVTVNAVEAESITLTPVSITLKVGQSETIQATVSPANTTYPVITWNTSDPTVVTVVDGVVTASGVGSATIRAMCGDVIANATVTVESTPAQNIILSSSEATMKANQSLQLNATVMPETTTDKTVTWISSDPTVATVTTGGLVTSLQVGSATITASCGNVSASCNITVEPTAATEIVINYAQISLKAGDIQQLTATVPEQTTDKTVIWSSSDESIVTVSENGLVNAISVGSATITATCGEVSATCQVIVESTPVSAIVLDKTNETINVGKTLNIVAEVYPENATDKTVIWTSSNLDVASVENGTVKALAPGTVVITATSGSVSASCTITVLQPAQSVMLNMNSLTLEQGGIIDLIATVNPADTTDPVSWTSSDESVVSVDQNGIVTAISEGMATVTVTCGTASASCEITVISPEVEVLVLNATELTLLPGRSQLLSVIVPDSYQGYELIWTSSDDNVVTVSSVGLVTAVEEGDALVTVTCGNLSANCLVTVISDDVDTSVKDILGNIEDGYKVYDLRGVKVLDSKDINDLNTLSTGLYIINGHKVYIRK